MQWKFTSASTQADFLSRLRKGIETSTPSQKDSTTLILHAQIGGNLQRVIVQTMTDVVPPLLLTDF